MNRSRRTVTLSLAGGVAVVGLAIGAVAYVASPVTHRTDVSTARVAGGNAVAAATIRMAIVGDSITQANSPDVNHGLIGDGSWVYYAIGKDVSWAGGWAKRGAQTSLMEKHVTAVDADVLVILAGANDLRHGVPFTESEANLKRIVADAGVTRVIVSAIPPQDAAPAGPILYNAELQRLATAEGWEFVDATAGLRDGDHYGAGLTIDGLHPTAAGAQIIGQAILAQVLSQTH